MNKYLYFLRHATAEIIRPNQLDIDRCLIEKGRLQARRVADFMQRHNLNVQQVFTSPYPRAAQTAAIVCKTTGFPGATEQPWLALETPVEQAIAQLQLLWPTLAEHTLLVGHEPDFSLLISRLLSTEMAVVNIRKASLSCISVSEDLAQAELQWSVPARFM
ncbi:SixA phosphatase family protein [Rheinheimera maricola]|uniref:Histidine phosphatase family protein n=1 Tax=Rheinheimera maricola TaxID=2793282 RepID=A0ABS7X7A0_9GAMM|nr:histidine phosphatase family protein [Rheinheimera maricola]MBZ9611423.1 histidine phosphatase family protein [Rheinheimera maricola]